MRITYLGEYTMPSFITWCLEHSKQFERITHWTKQTLNLIHISENPLPDVLVVKCDWEDSELTWIKRYSPDIPKLVVTCDHCLRKLNEYEKIGHIYRLEEQIKKEDLLLETLVDAIRRLGGQYERESY